MIKEVKTYSIECDNCGEAYVYEHNGWAYFTDEQTAHEYADEDGWHSDNEKDYCPACHSFDDDDNLIIKFFK